MGLFEGSVSLTRYSVSEETERRDHESISRSLKKQAFMDIDATADEQSIGWVEALDMLAIGFEPHTFNFGDFLCFGMRIDSRSVPPAIVKRYVTVAQGSMKQADGQPPAPEANIKELKNRIRQQLLSRTPVTTKIIEVCWFVETKELWLAGTGIKTREIFEELWHRTFGLGIKMKLPYLLAGGLKLEDNYMVHLDNLTPAAMFGGNE